MIFVLSECITFISIVVYSIIKNASVEHFLRRCYVFFTLNFWQSSGRLSFRPHVLVLGSFL
jgi:hypothetical protein